MGGDGGRPEVDGEAVKPAFVEARPDIQNAVAGVMVALVQRHGDFPFAFAQHRLQAAQHAQTGLGGLNAPLRGQRLFQAFKVARGIVHVGLGHLDKERARRRVHHDVALGRGFADHLFVDLGLGRHVNHDIAHDLGLTAQTAARQHAALGLVPLFHRVPGADGVFLDCHAMLGKLAISGCDLALRANATAPTDRIKVNAQLAGGLQDRGAKGNAGIGKDFLLGKGFCKAAGCTLLPDPSVVKFYDEPVLLMHGDSLCTRDISYMKLRRTLRNPLTLFILRHLPLRCAWTCCLARNRARCQRSPA